MKSILKLSGPLTISTMFGFQNESESGEVKVLICRPEQDAVHGFGRGWG